LALGLAYGFGVLWYELLPGKLAKSAWRVAAYPFIGIFIAETLFPVGLSFGGIHLAAAVIGSLVAVIVDWIITTTRHPAAVAQFEPRFESRLEPQAR
jgi:hypothetical protein